MMGPAVDYGSAADPLCLLCICCVIDMVVHTPLQVTFPPLLSFSLASLLVQVVRNW